MVVKKKKKLHGSSLICSSLAYCRLLCCFLEVCGEQAVPWGLYCTPLRPGGERSWGVGWRLVAAGGLIEARLDVHLIQLWCVIWTLLVLLSVVMPVRACVGIAVRYQILCGPGGAAVGQTHITFAIKSKILRGSRCSVMWWDFFLFLPFLFTLVLHWVALWLWCLTEDIWPAEAHGRCVRSINLLSRGEQVITVPAVPVLLQMLFVSVLDWPQRSVWGACR